MSSACRWHTPTNVSSSTTSLSRRVLASRLENTNPSWIRDTSGTAATCPPALCTSMEMACIECPMM